MVARADVFLDGTGSRAIGQRPAREDIIEAPADVSLPQVAPRCPPGEETAVWNVDGGNGDVSDVDGDNAVLVVERGVGEQWPVGRDRLADVEADARVRLPAVPIAPVALHLAERRGHLIARGFELLEAHDV